MTSGLSREQTMIPLFDGDKAMGRLTVSKQKTHTFHMERFNLRDLICHLVKN
jgi:hypothetical protein